MRIGWAWWTGRHLPPPRASPAEDFWEAFLCFGLSAFILPKFANFFPLRGQKRAPRGAAPRRRNREGTPAQGAETPVSTQKNCPPTHYIVRGLVLYRVTRNPDNDDDDDEPRGGEADAARSREQDGLLR
eukprot:scaffold52132_cov62-Phaeocystis_antarctica.AAC.1